MSNPNLNRAEAVLRSGKTHFSPIEDGKREVLKKSPSITQAKRFSRELMKHGKVIITKEA